MNIIAAAISIIGLLSFPAMILWVSFVSDGKKWVYLAISMLVCVVGVAFSLFFNSETAFLIYGLGLLSFLIYAVLRLGVIPETIIVYGNPVLSRLGPHPMRWITGIIAITLFAFVYVSLNRYQVVTDHIGKMERIRVFDRWTGKVDDKL